VLEMDEALSRQAAVVRAMEARSMNADGTFDVTVEDGQVSLGQVGYVS